MYTDATERNRQPALVFDVAHQKSFMRRKSITYLPKGGQGPSFFVEVQNSSTLIVHDGPNAAAPVIGTIDMHRRLSRTNFTLKADSVTRQPIQQSFEQQGLFRPSYACRIPAIRGDAAAQYRWKRTHGYGASLLLGGVVLENQAGTSQYAAYIARSAWSGIDGELRIFNPQLSPEAIQQIIVTSVAAQEIMWRNNRRGSAAASAGIAVNC